MSHETPAYSDYSEVPTHRKQWFFWLMYFTFTPVALTLLLFGDVYYQRNGEVRAFGTANKVIAGSVAMGIFVRAVVALAT